MTTTNAHLYLKTITIAMLNLPPLVLHHYGLMPRPWAARWMEFIGCRFGIPGLSQFLTGSSK